MSKHVVRISLPESTPELMMTDDKIEAEHLMQSDSWGLIHEPNNIDSTLNIWLFYRLYQMKTVYGQPWTEEEHHLFQETLASAPRGEPLNMTEEDAAFVRSVMCGEGSKADR